MAKRILIPIDFKVESLNTLKWSLLDDKNDTPVEAVLVYCELLSDSITELLFSNPRKRVRELNHEDFRKAMAILRNRFEGRLLGISIDLFQLNSVNGVRNFVTSKEIDHIYCPKKYKLDLGRRGFNPIPLLKKTGVPLTEVDWDSGGQVDTEDQLAKLFN